MTPGDDPVTTTESFRERMIRETEQLINKKRKDVEKLLEDAQAIENEVSEARQILHLLKTGVDRAPLVNQVSKPKQEEQAKEPPAEETPAPPPPAKEPFKQEVPGSNKGITLLKEEDLILCLQALPQPRWTLQDAMNVTGIASSSGMRHRVKQLIDQGLVQDLGVGPRQKDAPQGGRFPHYYRMVDPKEKGKAVLDPASKASLEESKIHAGGGRPVNV
jgi:predicted transcriptional regulator